MWIELLFLSYRVHTGRQTDEHEYSVVAVDYNYRRFFIKKHCCGFIFVLQTTKSPNRDKIKNFAK